MKVGGLQSIAQVTTKSAECNFAQLVSREDGRTIVSSYDWTDFFANITGIKKYTTSSPGKVFVREQCDSPEVEIPLLTAPWEPDFDYLPSVIPLRELSAEWQWYERIQPFCPEDDKDTGVHCQSQGGVGQVHHTHRMMEQQIHHHQSANDSVVHVINLGTTKNMSKQRAVTSPPVCLTYSAPPQAV
jgi:hypothetical protein